MSNYLCENNWLTFYIENLSLVRIQQKLLQELIQCPRNRKVGSLHEVMRRVLLYLKHSIYSSNNLIFTKQIFKKNSKNSSDKVKIRKSASECRYYLHDRDDYSHILALRWAVMRVFERGKLCHIT